MNLHAPRIPQITLRILQLPQNLVAPLGAPSPINLLHHALLHIPLDDALRVAQDRVLLQDAFLVLSGVVVQVQGGGEFGARLREFGAVVVEAVAVDFGGRGGVCGGVGGGSVGRGGGGGGWRVFDFYAGGFFAFLLDLVFCFFVLLVLVLFDVYELEGLGECGGEVEEGLGEVGGQTRPRTELDGDRILALRGLGRRRGEVAVRW